jgi:uncharacterized protein
MFDACHFGHCRRCAFWRDDISLLNSAQFLHGHIHSARQLTDLYLLAVVVHNQGRRVTFDQRIPPPSAVHGVTPAHLGVL